MGGPLKSPAEAYDQVAGQYDKAFTRPVDRAEDAVTFALMEQAFTKLPKADQWSVYDAGCGTGLAYENIHPLLRRHVKYVGVDISGEMVKRARAKQFGVEFFKGDICDRWHGDNDVDLVLSTYGPLSYCECPTMAINEFYRVLRPGGRVFAQVFGPRYTSRAHHITKDAVYLTYTARQLRSMFRAFQGVTVTGVNLSGSPALMAAETRFLGQVIPDSFMLLIVEGFK